MIGSIVGKLSHILEDNSTTILTGIGVAGTITTGVLAGRAGFRAAQILKEEEEKRYDLDPDSFPTKEKLWLVGPHFIPAVGVGGLTVAAIIFANRLSAKETAAMAAAYTMSDKTFQEYKEKVQEKLGQNKEQAIRDDVAQDRINRNPPTGRDVIITGNGDVLCYDVLTDRFFRSTIESIKRAENEVNSEILNHDLVSLSRFYEEINLKPTPYSDSVGWNLNNRCEIEISTVLSPDQQPCISLDFKRWPKDNYDNVYP